MTQVKCRNDRGKRADRTRQPGFEYSEVNLNFCVRRSSISLLRWFVAISIVGFCQVASPQGTIVFNTNSPPGTIIFPGFTNLVPVWTLTNGPILFLPPIPTFTFPSAQPLPTPANDNFANTLVLSGSAAEARATNYSATAE